jgi:hypothetical protein
MRSSAAAKRLQEGKNWNCLRPNENISSMVENARSRQLEVYKGKIQYGTHAARRCENKSRRKEDGPRTRAALEMPLRLERGG